MPERRDVGDGLHPIGKLGDRKEGPREEIQRSDHKAEHRREPGVVFELGGIGGQGTGEGQPGEGRREDGNQTPTESDCIEHCHDQHEHQRRPGQPDHHPAEMPVDEISSMERGVEGHVIVFGPLHAHHDRPRRVTGTVLHGGGRQQTGGEEHEVRKISQRRCSGAFVNELTETQAHGHQEQQRVQERGKGAPPPSLRIHTGVAFQDADCGRGGHQSTNVRPVKRRNTSSSVERRTTTDSGWRPRS